jgi:LysM repeat protein
VRASATPLPTNTPTDPPTATRTPRPSATPQPTATSTPTYTPTFTPTLTSTHTPTFTPTSTPTFTLTHTPTFTLTYTPTFTPTFTPTPTATPTVPLPTAIIIPPDTVLPTVQVIQGPNSSVTCIAPIGWVPYVVLPGETLFEIAQATGSTVGTLRRANCLDNADLIRSGSTIFVPRPVSGTVPTVAPVFPTAAPEGSASEPLAPQGCLVSTIAITAPEAGGEVSGSFDLIGSASAPGFRYFQVDVRPEGVETYDFYIRQSDPVVDGVLTPINTGLFGSGLHWIRLSVVDQDGVTLAPCAIPLIFR